MSRFIAPLLVIGGGALLILNFWCSTDEESLKGLWIRIVGNIASVLLGLMFYFSKKKQNEN